jgi:hypothetical protein
VGKLASTVKLPGWFAHPFDTSRCSYCPAFKGQYPVRITWVSTFIWLADDKRSESPTANATASLDCTTPPHALAIWATVFAWSTCVFTFTNRNT